MLKVVNVGVAVVALVVGVVLGGAVVYGVLYLLDNSSDSSSNSTGTRASDSLKLVIVVSRHGNRGGYVDYPTDPYPVNCTKYWPYGGTELTNVGRVQTYNLGAKLRSLYNGFLPSIFYPDDIFACSDKSERVIMSGQTILAGLYPPHGWQVWKKGFNWQPIVLYLNSSDHYEDRDSCSRFLTLQTEAAAQLIEKESANISAIERYIYEETGENITSTSFLPYMFDKLIVEYTEGYTLPSWTENLFLGSLADYTLKFYLDYCTATVEQIRLLEGELIDDILKYMGEKVNSTLSPDRKLVFFSGHDTTIITLQVAFGVPKETLELVKAGSAFILELHEDPETNEHSVQLLYIDGSSSDLEPVSLSLPSCGDPCSFGTFLTTVQNFTNVNYEEECQISNSSSSS